MNQTNEPDRDQTSQVLHWVGLAVLGWLVFLVVRPFLIPLGWAAVLAVVTYPVHARLATRWRPGLAAAATTALTTVVVIVPAVMLIVAFVQETLEIAGGLQATVSGGPLGWIGHAWARVVRVLPAASSVDLAALITDALRRTAAYLMVQSGSIFQNVASFLIDLTLALFATFFLLRDADAIMRVVRRLLPMDAARREALIARTRGLISAGVTSSVLVAGLQGVLGGVAFAIVGINAPVFWGVVMAFMCVLPFGAWVIWLPAAVFLAVSGSTTRALVLGGLGLGIVSSVDNVLRPALLSGQAHMNGLVIFVSLLGGLSVFGLLGLVLGPVLVATALSLVTTYVDHESTTN
jgi:predicted PurR-regulated permease PerM